MRDGLLRAGFGLFEDGFGTGDCDFRVPDEGDACDGFIGGLGPSIGTGFGGLAVPPQAAPPPAGGTGFVQRCRAFPELTHYHRSQFCRQNMLIHSFAHHQGSYRFELTSTGC